MSTYILIEAKKIRITDRSNRGSSTIASRTHVKYGNFPKVRAGSQSGQNCFSIVRNNLQLATVYDVHFFANFTLSANVVLRRKQNRLKSKDQGTQETSFGVLKYFNSLQGVQMNVDGNFGLQLGCVCVSIWRWRCGKMRMKMCTGVKMGQNE